MPLSQRFGARPLGCVMRFAIPWWCIVLLFRIVTRGNAPAISIQVARGSRVKFLTVFG